MMAKRKVKRKVLGVGYPWFLYEAVFTNDRNTRIGYFKVLLMDGPSRQDGRNPVELNFNGLGAFKKIRLIAEYE